MSLGALASASKRASRLILSEVHEIGPNYAETLRRWRENFDAQIDEVGALGYDKRFERTWHFCLAFCEAGFRTRALVTCRSRCGDRSNQPARSSASTPRWLR